jgi:hypothetical protein
MTLSDRDQLRRALPACAAAVIFPALSLLLATTAASWHVSDLGNVLLLVGQRWWATVVVLLLGYRAIVARWRWFGAWQRTCLAFDLAFVGYLAWRCSLTPSGTSASALPGGHSGAEVAYGYAVLSWYSLVPFLPVMGWPLRERNGAWCECGYDLTGNRSGRCPECGTDVGAPARLEGVSSRQPGGQAAAAAPVSVFQSWFVWWMAALLIVGVVLYFLLQAVRSAGALFVPWLTAFVVWHLGNTVGRGDVPASALFPSWRAVTVVPIAIELWATVVLGVFWSLDFDVGTFVCLLVLGVCPLVTYLVVRDAVRRYRARLTATSGS